MEGVSMTAETTKAAVGQPKSPPQVDPALTTAQQEATFWKLKYFELQQHTNQIIGALARPTVAGALQDQLAALGYRQQNGNAP